MYRELTVRTNSQDLKIFIQDGFYSGVAPSKHLHAHSFAELHIVTCENSVLNVNNRNYRLNPGDMAIIPKGFYHRCVSDDCCFRHTAFQIDHPTSEFEIFNISRHTAECFMEEIRRIEKTEDYTIFAAYVPLFAAHFEKNFVLRANPVTNQKFLIREFFSQRYSEDIHLGDLADVLHVSERHAERLVADSMGKTFKEQLMHTRIQTAKSLLQTTDMPLCKIAAYVGYKSYAGFWKAMQKYGNA